MLYIGGGALEQGGHALHVIELHQPGGELVGGSAPLIVDESARVGGLLTTPSALMSARSLDIATGGVVRLGADGKLNLTGEGTPLTGAGLLDITTHRPNSVELTGKKVSDIALAGPAGQLRAAGLDQMDMQAGLQRAGAAPSVIPWRRPALKPLAAFVPTDRLVFEPSEDFLSVAVIDSANGMAYFGTNTIPGQVVKVKIAPASFARVGVVTLNDEEEHLTSAVIDLANSMAYFGTGTSPGRVVKVSTAPASFARVGAVTLNTEESDLYSAVIDPANGLAYFGTYTSPGRVVKVNIAPASFARVGAITLDSAESVLTTAVVDPANGLAYFGTETSPGRVVQVNVAPAGFARVDAITLNAGEIGLSTAVLDPANGMAYFGTNTSPGRVVKVNIAPASFGRVDAVTLNPGDIGLSTAVLDSANGMAYFGTETIPGRVVQVNVAPASFARVDAVTLNTGENYLYSAVIDLANGLAYFGTATNPGRVIRIRVSQPEIAVLGNGQGIGNGDTTPALADHSDFGSTRLGGTITRTFTISNSGSLDLSLTGAPPISLGGAAAGDFSVVGLPATPVAADSATSFQVRFSPSAAGLRAATVAIPSSDGHQSPYIFSIQGKGTNSAPVASAGIHQTVAVGATVALNGSASADPDGHTPLMYSWTQISGPAVLLSSTSAARPTFSAPSSATVLTFRLVVTDSRGLASSPATVTITVHKRNGTLFLPFIMR